jgi:serine/threonine protein kinase
VHCKARAPGGQRAASRPLACEISVDLVVTITNNFSDEKKLGEGAFGDVYEGVVEDTENQRQVRVAVKRLKPSIRLQGDETEHRAALTSIRCEIHVLGRFYHPNIIRLLGFTSTSAGTAQELCLVYELGQHGSLDKMLVDSERAKDLSCKVRVRIAAGVSRALNYLHCHDPRGPAFHRDVKSANIVLDLGLSPKLIDCGLSKFIPEQNRLGTIMSTHGAALGTPGYMCPTYQRTLNFESKSEIYSFGMVLLELMTGRIQGHQGLDENDLFAVYIEEDHSVLSDLDTRADPWTTTCAEQVEALARECLAPHRRRIGTMLAVMRRLVDLEKQFCLATDEERRMLRLAEDLQRELDALRLQVSRQEADRVKANRTCIVCFDDKSEGVDCETSRDHFICAECVPQEVQRVLQEIREPAQLARHREQGGRIKCVQPDCEAAYPEPALARVLSDDLFRQFRAAQDAVVEQRLFDQLQHRFQEELAAVRAELERGNSQARTQQDAAATAEFMRRQYPNAVQCPRCGAGPVIPENCYDLQAHHGERARGGGQINNACPACEFFSRERGDWVRWNGQMR